MLTLAKHLTLCLIISYFMRLAAYGIAGSSLQWLQQFFRERSHKTRVGYALSSSAQLVSGVVQGIGIGSLMFLIFINELAEVLDRAGVKVRLFADDVKVYVQIVGNYDVDNCNAPWTCWWTGRKPGN